MSINCENYVDGMCFYINSRYAIYEPCKCEKLPKESRKEKVENCELRKTIQRLRKEEGTLEQVAQEHNV